MTTRRTVKTEVLRGPFGTGGQPEAATGQPMELSFFAWNVRSGFSANKAALAAEEYLCHLTLELDAAGAVSGHGLPSENRPSPITLPPRICPLLWTHSMM